MAIERDERPWGYYEVVDEGDGFREKRICVRPGQRLSYQRHTARSEHWYVVVGSGLATLDGVDQRVVAGATVDIPVRAAHRIANDGEGDLVFVEVQTGSYFGEDDIERFADDYGRPVREASAVD
ncbi:MAG: phosphomannose isomerase type II C-terminal cupin domain [Nocardioidaceae bacterium]